jgi:hypothetical protein
MDDLSEDARAVRRANEALGLNEQESEELYEGDDLEQRREQRQPEGAAPPQVPHLYQLDPSSHVSRAGTNRSANTSITSRGGTAVRGGAVPPIPPLAGILVPEQVVSSQPPVGGAGGGGGGGGGAGAPNEYDAMFPNAPIVVQADTVEVILPKSRRGTPGSKDYRYNMTAATDAIATPFGVAVQLVTTKEEAEDGNATKRQYIQEAYVSNLSKLDDVDVRIKEYDMKLILMVPKGVKDATSSKPKEMFVSAKVYLIKSWDKVEWTTACLWQWCINTMGRESEKTSSLWLYKLLHNSCTSDLRELINVHYTPLGAEFKGGVTFAWLLFRRLFSLNRDTTAALKKFLTIFSNTGLRKFPGESVALANKQIMAVVRRLHEADDLPSETVVEVLTGYTLCSVSEFATLFGHMLQQAKQDSLGMAWDDDKGNTFAEVKALMAKAAVMYESLSTTQQWHVPKGHRLHSLTDCSSFPRKRSCWNCGKDDHQATNCPKPRDQKTYDANREKFFAKSPGGGGGAGKGRGKGGNYDRPKWAPPKKGSAMTVQWHNGTPYVYCTGKNLDGSVCGWSSTHSKGTHGKAMSDPSFNICSASPKHPLALALQGGGPPGGAQKPPPSAPEGAGGANLSLNKAELKKKLDIIQSGVSGQETLAVLEAVKAAFSLN